jgi:FKBP-type peptidyl-prolyl cis-trans isomerase
MKQNLILLAIVFVVGLSACTEDQSMDWKIINDHWAALHQNDSGFVQTASGLQYCVVHNGFSNDRSPSSVSKIVVKYSGKLVDGTVFGSGTRDTMYFSSVVAGWQEGLKKMHEGSVYKFHIPSSLGYGTSTSNPAIPANSILIFDVTLLEVINNY